MEQRDPTRSEPRRQRLAFDERRRKDAIHALVIPSSETFQHRAGISYGPSTSTVHRTGPTGGERDGVVQGRLDSGERRASSGTEHGGCPCGSLLVVIGAWFDVKLKATRVPIFILDCYLVV